MKFNFNTIRSASIELQKTSEAHRTMFLRHLDVTLQKRKSSILSANALDVREAKKNKRAVAFVQRLAFGAKEHRALRAKVRSVATLQSHLGEAIERRKVAGGLLLKKVRVPLGVLLVIYEARPEVTIDVAALCVKSGNAALLKGGSDARRTNKALHACIVEALKRAKLPKGSISIVPTREAVRALLKQHENIDLVIARGGYSLVRAIMSESSIPVMAHAAGGARIYVDKSADRTLAERVLLNAKLSKPAACNSLDTVLVHKDLAGRFIPRLVSLLRKKGVKVLGDTVARRLARVEKAHMRDWDEEFLGLTVAVRVVNDVGEATRFVNAHTKRHSEGIIATDRGVIRKFTAAVDAAALFINASTRLHDGYIFGLGSEMGISAGKLHARGPVGLRELTTYKWEVYGKGNIRK